LFIKELYLSNINISQKDLIYIFSNMTNVLDSWTYEDRLKYLQILNLSHNYISTEATKVLSNYILRLSSLEKLFLSNCNLNDNSIKNLCDCLS
jgi:Ran GTPase-activating protein (RanGAP) involved in mRNA processing and transport